MFIPIVYSISDRLAKSERVNANTLLVEGWLPPYAIKMAYDEFQNNGYSQIITTGINSPDYCLIFTNGYLIFYPKGNILPDNKIRKHVIEVDGYSELGGENSSQFNVFINNSIVGNFQAEKRKKKYAVTWMGRLNDIDSIMVQFINDGVGNYGDRNLFVKGIIIDGKTVINYQNNSEYEVDLSGKKIRIINNFSSYAEIARNRLLSMGIDSSKVIAVSGKRVKINRTLTSALAFRDWLKTSEIEVKGINIVTLGAHAKRTWMTYNNILNKSYDIGIISLPDYKNNHSRKNKILKTLRETLGIIYYSIILSAY